MKSVVAGIKRKILKTQKIWFLPSSILQSIQENNILTVKTLMKLVQCGFQGCDGVHGAKSHCRSSQVHT